MMLIEFSFSVSISSFKEENHFVRDAYVKVLYTFKS